MKKRLMMWLMALAVLVAGCGKKENAEKGVVGTCTLEVECSTIFDHMDWLDQSVKDYVPVSGIIFEKKKAAVQKGDSVYDVLERELKKEKILMEASFTGSSAYIEGIDNIYEFSCGELSGWVYSVNKEIPQKSCSEYQVKDGDVIEWHYTCDLGEDVKE